MAATEGPVMALISKRLRAPRKKNNRITEMEESISQGKTLNKDQEEILRSKPIITALIDELVKLRLPPPSTPVSEATNNKKHKARKEMVEENDVSANADDIEDCKIADDGLNSDEVSNDSTSPPNGTSEGAASSGKSRRKRKPKKPQTSN